MPRAPESASHPACQLPAPRSNYGLSKYVGELYIEMLQRTSGLDYTILRYSNAFGPRQDPHGEAGVVAIFTGLMLAGQQCTIDGDGEQKKDYDYVGDIARANVLALTRGSGQALNIGRGAGTTVNEIFAVLSAATGNAVGPRNGPPREGDVRNFWLDYSRARASLGWEPQVTFEEGVRLTVESMKAAV